MQASSTVVPRISSKARYSLGELGTLDSADASYGVLTFARYLGAYSDLGWAWNRRPGSGYAPSAEMVECAAIFTYGITNTWMERFGASPGSAYTVKQVQHISIAVM